MSMIKFMENFFNLINCSRNACQNWANSIQCHLGNKIIQSSRFSLCLLKKKKKSVLCNFYFVEKSLLNCSIYIEVHNFMNYLTQKWTTMIIIAQNSFEILKITVD